MARTLDARAKEIFERAIDMRKQDRDALIRGECGDDAELQDRVVELLRAAEDDDAFLAGPTLAGDGRTETLRLAIDEDRPGAIIGQYRIVNLVGEGGFGSVYRAEQTSPVRREVALKIIKLGMDTRSVVARFEQERQALALMDHAHIAKVLDAGATRSGRPYFVMEFVSGEPITRYCDDHRLPIRQRLELFCQVCHAVQHAHTKGVIHRDIKPANILVGEQDGGPVARVIDFGVAKAIHQPLTDRTFHTEARQFIGTPEYMSPEQAAGSLDIDTRSDVYSLGVVLYEMLAGVPPLEPARLRSSSLPDLQRIIQNEDPPPPSTRLTSVGVAMQDIAARRSVESRRLALLLRGDLDLIAMRALEKDRARRYDSPGNLAADIQRHLRGEVIEAAPTGMAYRARKFVIRNRSLVTASLLVLAALLVGLGSTLWQAHEARQAARTAERLRAETDRIARFQAARLKALDLQRAGQQIRSALVDSASPTVVESLAGINFTDVARNALERGIFDDAVTAAMNEFEDAPKLKAQMLISIGETMNGLGMSEAADDALLESLAIRRRELGDDHEATLLSLSLLGANRLSLGRFEEAEQYCREAADRAAIVHGEDHEITLTTRSNLAACLLRLNRISDAEKIFRAVHERRRVVSGPDDLGRIRAAGNLGQVLKALDRGDESVALLEECLDGMRRVQGANHAETFRIAGNLAQSWWHVGRARDAEKLLRDIAAQSGQSLGSEHPVTLMGVTNLARLLVSRDAFNKLALSTQEKLFTPEEIQAGLVECESLYRQVLESYVRLYGEDHRSTLDVRANHASCLDMLGRHAEAATELERTLTRQVGLNGPNSIGAIMTRAQLGPVLTTLGRFAEAEEMFLSVERAMAGHGPSPRSHSELARLYEAWDKAEPGRGYAEKAAERRRMLEAEKP